MNQLLRLIILLFIISCSSSINENETTQQDTSNISLLKTQPIKKNKKSSHWDTLYISTNKETIVLGDSMTKKIEYVSIKYHPIVQFRDFSVDSVYKGTQAAIDYSSNILGKRFKTVITETYSETGVNFAGHYCLVQWGCGSPCQYCVIVDAISGKIYNGVDAALGYSFKIDSRMIIVNPTDSTNYYLDCPYCKPLVYIFNEQKKTFNLRD